MISQSYSPIALFVYNREEHTRKTLNHLNANSLASRSKLYIFCDGPQNSSDQKEVESVNKTRKVVDDYPWKGEKIVIKQKENLGLAKSIHGGVSDVLKQHHRIIVMEDDLIVSSSFLSYMNDALIKYEASEEVYQISGYMIPHKLPLRNPGFLRAPGSWGWATWADKWGNFDLNDYSLLNSGNERNFSRFDLGGFYPHLDSLRKNKKGKLDTWGVKWYAHIFLRDGLCLYPPHSLVKNIGHDKSGVNCGDKYNTVYGRQEVHEIEKCKFIHPKESKLFLWMFKSFYINKDSVTAGSVAYHYTRSRMKKWNI